MPQIPGSKSVLQRILVLMAHCKADMKLTNYNPCADVLELETAMRTFGYRITAKENERVFYYDRELAAYSKHSYMFHASATALRLWICVLASLDGVCSTISISKSLLNRGIEPLLKSLADIGADIHLSQNTLNIQGKVLAGSTLSIQGSISSQYASSLLLAAPFMLNDLTLEIPTNQVSKGYIDLTIKMLQSCGASIAVKDTVLKVMQGMLILPKSLSIDPDMSFAAYYAVKAALLAPKTKISVATIYPQPDSSIFGILESLGIRVIREGDDVTVHPGQAIGGTVSIKNCPDLMPILSVFGLFCQKGLHLEGVSRLKHKESDRLHGICKAFDAIGATYILAEDSLQIQPMRKKVESVLLDTQQDHRLVMAFTLLKTMFPNISLSETASVCKSIPKTWVWDTIS